MLRYALQTLLSRKGSFIGAFLALFCAAALVSSCGILLETGLRGTIATERYAGTPVVVAGDQNVHQTTVTHKHGKTKTKTKSKPVSERVWLPASTADRLTGLPGVRRVVPELTFPAYAVDEQGQLATGPGGTSSYGHAWSSAALTPFILVQGSAPATDDAVVLDRDLARRVGAKVGSRLIVQSTGDPGDYLVTGIAAAAGGELQNQSSLFFSDTEARRLADRPGQVSAIGVLAKDGVSPTELAGQVRRALNGTTAQVHTGGDRGPVEFLDAANARIKLVSMGGAIGGTALLVAILVVVGTFGVSIQQRYREIALLRAVAATPKQVRRLIGREALLVSILAGAPGALVGLPIAFWLHVRFVDLKAVPDTLQVTFSVVPFLAAFAGALVAAFASARIAARRIARISPAEALAEAAIEQRHFSWGRILLGLVVLAGGIVLLVVLSGLNTEPASTPVTFLTVIVLSVAVSLLGVVIARLAVAALGVPLRASRVRGYLAAANARSCARRMASAVTPLALLIGMACTVFFVPTTLAHAARAQTEAGTTADWVVASAGPGVPEGAVQALRQTAGVTAVTEVVRSTVRVGVSKYSVQGLSPDGLARNVDLGVVHGSMEQFGSTSVALSEVAADRLGMKPGNTLHVTLGDHTEESLEVVAVYDRGLGFGDLTVSHDLLAAHIDNPLASSVLVRGSDRAALSAAVRRFPGVTVLDRGQVDKLQAKVEQSNAAVNYLAMGLVIAFTAIAVVNTLAMSVSDRRREFALLRLIGTTRRQVMGMLRLESALVVVTAAALGSGIALAVLTTFSLGMTGAASPAIEPLRYLGVLAVAAALALLAVMVPGRLALTGHPASVIGARE